MRCGKVMSMYDFNAELLAHHATSETLQFVATQLGIVVLENASDDEILAVWVYEKGKLNPNGTVSFSYQQISCKSHSGSASIISVLKTIKKLSTCKYAIKLVSYDIAKKIVEREMRNGK